MGDWDHVAGLAFAKVSRRNIADIPRHLASRREFPGIVKRNGTRRIYVDIAKFDKWFREGVEVK